MLTFTLKIVGIRKETHDSCTICFKQPALKKVKYLPGQYLTLIVIINNRKYKRPYSLSSAPGIDSTIDITVKRLPHGVVSNHLMDVVKEGDILEVIEPMGDFTYVNNLRDVAELFLWGAGSGITPLFSIIKTALQTSTKKITLCYGNKNAAQTIFHDQLIKIKEQYSDRFSLRLFYSEHGNIDGTHGRIADSDIVEILKKSPDSNNSIHYICGPVGLKQVVKRVLLNNGVQIQQIFSEDFEHVVDQKELEGINTQFVEIIKAGQKNSIEVVRGKSVLEAGLDSEIDLPYSCQTGSCTLCKARLIAGEVKIITGQQADHDLNEDERLLCCSYPITDNVIFEII